MKCWIECFSKEKWLKNEISKHTYEKWYSTYQSTILSSKSAFERLGNLDTHVFTVLQKI